MSRMYSSMVILLNKSIWNSLLGTLILTSLIMFVCRRKLFMASNKHLVPGFSGSTLSSFTLVFIAIVQTHHFLSFTGSLTLFTCFFMLTTTFLPEITPLFLLALLVSFILSLPLRIWVLSVTSLVSKLHQPLMVFLSVS